MVQVKIRSSTGAQTDGILLWLRGRIMRVAVPKSEDVAELRCQEGQWYAESGDPVELDIQAVPAHPPNTPAPRFDVGDCPPVCDTPSWLN
jgi:hypothetical protein